MARVWASLVVAGVTAASGVAGPARADAPPVATAVGGDAPSDAPDSATTGGRTSAAAAEMDTLPPASPDGPNVGYIIPIGDPPFTAMQAHDATLGAFGALGGIAMAVAEMSEGHKIITDNDVKNPGVSIGRALAGHMAHDLHAGVAPITVAPKKHSVADLAADGAAAHARYVVAANTIMWGFVYHSLNWGSFHVTYMAAMDLIDTQSGKVILKARCNYHPDKDESVGKDVLLADHAAVLKARLQHAADHCAGEFEGKLPKL